MDFSKYDNRAAAETGTRLELVDPNTGEPITSDGKPCAVQIRGVASRSVQAALRERQKARVKARKGKTDDEAERVMEDVHKELCDAAAPLVIGFENVERDGKKCKVPDDVEWFLDLTFPIMGTEKDEDGNPVIEDNVPRFKMLNNPFAKQITEASSEMALASGNAQPG